MRLNSALVVNIIKSILGSVFWGGADVPLLAFVLDTLLVATFRLAEIDSHGVHRLFTVVGVAVSANIAGGLQARLRYCIRHIGLRLAPVLVLSGYSLLKTTERAPRHVGKKLFT